MREDASIQDSNVLPFTDDQNNQWQVDDVNVIARSSSSIAATVVSVSGALGIGGAGGGAASIGVAVASNVIGDPTPEADTAEIKAYITDSSIDAAGDVELLALANQMARDNGMGERVTFEKADVQEIPYEDNSFDALTNLQMLHIVEKPIAMLDEMERVLTPDGALLMADIRRSWVGLLDKVFRTALTVEEAGALVRQSALRDGTFSHDLLWWRYEA